MRAVTPSRSVVTRTAVGWLPHLNASALACNAKATPCAGCVRAANPAIQSDRSGVMSIVAAPTRQVDAARAARRDATPIAATPARNSRRCMATNGPSDRGQVHQRLRSLSTELLTVRRLLEQRGHIPLALLQVRHAVLHPVRLRRILQKVVEILGEVHGPVFLVVALPETMLLAVVREHIRLFAEPAHRG